MPKESKSHRLLKEYAKLLLSKVFHFPNKYIYEEFAIGSVRYDVIAYPPVEFRNESNIIGVECGNIKNNVLANYTHFKKALEFVNVIIWIPYDIRIAPCVDLVSSRIKDIIFSAPRPFEIFNKKYAGGQKSCTADEMIVLFITKKERFPFLDKDISTKWIL